MGSRILRQTCVYKKYMNLTSCVGSGVGLAEGDLVGGTGF